MPERGHRRRPGHFLWQRSHTTLTIGDTRCRRAQARSTVEDGADGQVTWRLRAGVDRRTVRGRRVATKCAVAVASVLALTSVGLSSAAPAGAAPLLQQVSSDPLTNAPTVPSGVHHATEVETDSLSQGSTIVSSFQVGRFAAYGGSATGWATSTDAGQTWQHGLLPGLSSASPSPNAAFVSVANQSVLFDAAHATWLIPTVGVVNCAMQVPTSKSCVGHVATEHTLLVNRSSDGLTWGQPVAAVTSNVDKPWGVCDNSPSVSYTHLRAHETGRNL